MPFRHLKWHLTFKSTPFLQSFFKQDMTVNNLFLGSYPTQAKNTQLTADFQGSSNQIQELHFRSFKSQTIQRITPEHTITEWSGYNDRRQRAGAVARADLDFHDCQEGLPSRVDMWTLAWCCQPDGVGHAGQVHLMTNSTLPSWLQTRLGKQSKAQHSPAQPYPRPYLPHVFDQKEPEALNPGFRWTMWHLQSEPGQEHEQVQEQQLDSSFLKSWQQLLLYACCRVVSSHTAVSHL